MMKLSRQTCQLSTLSHGKWLIMTDLYLNPGTGETWFQTVAMKRRLWLLYRVLERYNTTDMEEAKAKHIEVRERYKARRIWA